MHGLKFYCKILDVERGGKKEEILERLMNFLMEPKSKPAAKKGTCLFVSLYCNV